MHNYDWIAEIEWFYERYDTIYDVKKRNIYTGISRQYISINIGIISIILLIGKYKIIR